MLFFEGDLVIIEKHEANQLVLFFFIEVISFANVLQSSLLGVQTSPAWCENCNKYQPTVSCLEM